MKLTKRIYIASPYTHINKRVVEYRERVVSRVISDLTVQYKYAFFGPITQSHRIASFNKKELKGTFEQWSTIDYTWLSVCDELWVVTIPGWKESLGVQSEIVFAENLCTSCYRYADKIDLEYKCVCPVRIKIKYVDPTTLKVSKRAPK